MSATEVETRDRSWGSLPPKPPCLFTPCVSPTEGQRHGTAMGSCCLGMEVSRSAGARFPGRSELRPGARRRRSTRAVLPVPDLGARVSSKRWVQEECRSSTAPCALQGIRLSALPRSGANRSKTSLSLCSSWVQDHALGAVLNMGWLYCLGQG